MLEWSNVRQWDPAPLAKVADACLTRQQRVEAVSNELFQMQGGMQSQGETPEAIRGFLSRRASTSDRLSERLTRMAEASMEASRGVNSVLEKVHECYGTAASRKMEITPSGVVRIHPSYLPACQADPQRFAHAQIARQEVADMVRSTLALAARVDASYQSALFDLSDEGAANDPVSPGPAEDAPNEVPYLDDALGFSYDLLMDWMDSSTAQQIRIAAALDRELFNDMLAMAVAYRGDDLSWDKFASLAASGGRWLTTPLVGVPLAVAHAAYELYDNIRVGAPWDMKPYLAERYGQPLEHGYFYLTDEQGNRVRSDVFGNVSYGYMLAHFGVDEQIALDAANVGAGDTGIGEDPVDDNAIRLGYELYRRYSDDMTKEEYIEEMKEADLGE